MMSEVIKLEWSEPKPPTAGVSSYDHSIADSPIGEFRVEWKSWKQYPSYVVYSPDGNVQVEDSLEKAVSSAQETFEKTVMECLRDIQK